MNHELSAESPGPLSENIYPQYDKAFHDVSHWLAARRLNWVISDENKRQYTGTQEKVANNRYIQFISEIIEPQYSATAEFEDSSRQRSLCTMTGLKIGFLIAQKAEASPSYDLSEAMLDLRLMIAAEEADNVGERGRITRDFVAYGQAGLRTLGPESFATMSEWQEKYLFAYSLEAQDYFAISIGAALASSKKAHDDRLFLKLVGYDWDQALWDTQDGTNL